MRFSDALRAADASGEYKRISGRLWDSNGGACAIGAVWTHSGLAMSPFTEYSKFKGLFPECDKPAPPCPACGYGDEEGRFSQFVIWNFVAHLNNKHPDISWPEIADLVDSALGGDDTAQVEALIAEVEEVPALL